MTYKAYLDNIQAKTGKSPADFIKMAREKGYLQRGVKTGEIVSWLKNDFGLGQGHAMAIVLLIKQSQGARPPAEQRVSKQFSGQREHWRKTYDNLLTKVGKFGPDVTVSPTDSYISLLRKGRKFAIVQVRADRMDIGIKRKGIAADERFKKAGAWNAMVTHRVRIDEPRQIDARLMSWLRQAYNAA